MQPIESTSITSKITVNGRLTRANFVERKGGFTRQPQRGNCVEQLSVVACADVFGHRLFASFVARMIGADQAARYRFRALQPAVFGARSG
jgi:hypothetical protein